MAVSRRTAAQNPFLKRNPATIDAAIGQSSFDGSAKAQGLGAHHGDERQQLERARPAMEPRPRPDQSPHRGDTAPGVIERFIDATLGAAQFSKYGNKLDPQVGNGLPTSELRGK
jgi:diadenosine tetraphosphatase ApaH/serine/threonine PP2A family protein phosphatase